MGKSKIMRMNKARKLNADKTWRKFQQMGFIDGVDHGITHTKINGAHKNKPCAVIGSGFSAKGVDFDNLHKIVTIAINHGIEVFQKADYLIFQDHRFLKLNKFDLKTYPGTIAVANSNPIVANKEIGDIIAFVPMSLKQKPTEDIRDGLYARKSTGLCALNLAIVLGCNPIYLLGCDMPKDWREIIQIEDGIHVNKDYRGSVDTIKALEGYGSTLDLYEPFGRYANRIINVCGNGMIKYFRQITMEMFNNKLKEIK